MNTKTCTQCHKTKSLGEFHRHRSSRLGRHSWCRDCFNAAKRARPNAEDTKKKRQRNYMSRYGLAEADIEAMMRQQGGRCAICDEQLRDYKVDHNHKTGQVRGLLCHCCNLKIAGIEDQEFYEMAIEYLMRADCEAYGDMVNVLVIAKQ